MSRLNEWMQLVVAALTAIGMGAGGFFALRKWLRGWIAGVAEDSREAARQLTTSNGTTVAQYVERMDKQIAEVNTLAQNNAIRIEAVAAMADVTSRRLDEHLVRDHGPEYKPV